MASIDQVTDREPFHSIHVIVLNWNQWELTTECIESLLRAEVPPRYRLSLIVVDNASQDDSAVKLEQKFQGSITLLRNTANLGYAGGNNVGIRYALAHSADFVMVLNNDTKVKSDFLQPLIVCLNTQTEVGVVTPKIYFMHEPETVWAVGGEITPWLGKGRSRGRGELDVGQFDQPQRVDYATGCCFLTTRSVFEQVGLFDERYFAYFEDTDWSRRVWRHGWQIWYAPTSVVWHVAGASSNGGDAKVYGRRTPYLVYLLTRNNLWFIRSHTYGWQRPIALTMFFAYHVLFYSVAYLVLLRFQKFRSLWLGVSDGAHRHDARLSAATATSTVASKAENMVTRIIVALAIVGLTWLLISESVGYAYLNLGAIYLARATNAGEPSTARQLAAQSEVFLLNSLDTLSRQRPALRLLGFARMLQGHTTLAMEAWNAAEHMSEEFIGRAERAKRVSDYAQVVRWYEYALMLDPSSYASRKELARSYRTLQDFEAAARHLEINIGADPSDAEAQYILCDTYRGLGRLERGLALFAAASATVRQNPQMQACVGKIYWDLGEYVEAAHHLELAVSQLPQEAALHNWLSLVYNRQGRMEEAIVESELAVSLDPYQFGYLQHLVNLYITAQQYQEAQSAVASFVDANPDDPAALTLLQTIQAHQ